MSLKSMMLMLTALLVIGCQKSSDSGDSTGEVKASPVLETQNTPEEFTSFDGNLKESDLKIEVLPHADFGRYHLNISWTRTIPVMQVQVARGPLVTKRDAFTYSQIVSHGQTLNVHFRVLNTQGEVISVQDAEIDIPQDLLIQEKMYLKKDTRWNLGRLHIQGGMIITQGFKLSIQADELLHHKEDFTKLNLDPSKHSIMTYDQAPSKDSRRHGKVDDSITIYARTLLGGFSIALIEYDYSYPLAAGKLEGMSVPDLKFSLIERSVGSLSVIRKVESNRWVQGSLTWGMTSIGIDKHWEYTFGR